MNEERAARNHFRLLLASARADALADAEGAERVIFAIESFGRFLHRSDSALERTSPAAKTDLRSVRLDSAPANPAGFGILLGQLVEAAEQVRPGEKATNLDLDRGHVLVVRPAEGDAPSELVGIITPSDVA
jgi:hypothetical protein